jgi:4-hydroxyproline epimerase
MSSSSQAIQVIDSHTEGEPTRVIVTGGPDLGSGSLSKRRDRFRDDFDQIRSAVVNEPRGSDVAVGALLCAPVDPSCATGVIFFNNVGYLHMCGHGTMGVIVTLAHLGRIQPGGHRIETPAGVVSTVLHEAGEVSVENVPSYRKEHDLAVAVPGLGTVKGDIAWGGNWFFLIHEHGQALELANVDALTDYTWRVRQAVNASGHPEVDHVELSGPPQIKDANSKNFVLCPGKAYDRSPCGTGTCARVACLAAAGKLSEGEVWVQESITGSAFSATYRRDGKDIVPTITGRAFVNGTSTLLFDPGDPYRFGMRRP